ncbi:unnamed protein product [Rotaria magnacalcarata]|uniref:EF-hand domain-containing protein n=3 Tax=Rotaria magnacalcarata TaxID=392030 RepID=A0A819UXS3_9BILA|nr:unnamed protein product [Rotaria magnacalcarata]CAF1481848.1 unnamed protein product [Rotaria magnacalcarata]CAF2047669.1 unnamed protein product [Rotaria magnacalcarata]CAF2063090.1 unnamed protein product [Rotaria magnacalcarata]CAF2102540.1 unnamed protein product [Rotaria magnacalcarata]
MGNKEARVKRGKALSDADVTELSNLSGFTPQQVREWHSGFLKDCPSGKLNKKKFIEVYKQFYPTGKAEKFCEYVFRTFDTDGSGNIDFGEFLIAISITAQQDPRKKLEWAFSMYDIDRNGYIEKKEMKKIMDAIYDLLGEEKRGSNSPEMKVDQIFSKMDINSDQKLSKDEFVSGCLQDDYLRKLLAPSAS